jgi:Pyrimidine dimer DNA glycosylase
MRLWTLHPRYLDTKGLLAVWREGLLAQEVLRGRTKGYRNHPQLVRFKSSTDPLGSIARYLRVVYVEACERGYNFSRDKIDEADCRGKIQCTRGQLLYEWEHLKRKLRARDAGKYKEAEGVDDPEAHTLFRIVEGDVEDWEMLRGRLNKAERVK